jgi:hypothetical protein
MSRVSVPGHIGGTRTRDPPRNVENCRDLRARSGALPAASTEVREPPTQDPAYRPAHPLFAALACGGALVRRQPGHSGGTCAPERTPGRARREHGRWPQGPAGRKDPRGVVTDLRPGQRETSEIGAWQCGPGRRCTENTSIAAVLVRICVRVYTEACPFGFVGDSEGWSSYMTAFTQALYYPWQDIHDEAWLRTAFLYWDEIATIVAPGDSRPYKTAVTRALDDNGLLRPINDYPFEAEAAGAMLRSFAEMEAWKGILTEGERGHAVHLLREEKQSWITATHYEAAGVALRRSRDRMNWRHLKGNVAHLYLTILASLVSQSTGRALITDKPGMRVLADSVRVGYPLPGTIELGDGRILPIPKGGALEPVSSPKSMQVYVVELALQALHVDPSTPIAKLIDFRENHSYELVRFRDEVDRLGRELRDVLERGEYASTPTAMEQAARDTVKGIEAALVGLERQLRARHIASRREWLEIAMLAAAPSAMAAPALGLKSMALGAVTSTIRIGFDLRKSRARQDEILDGNPYSYLMLAQREFARNKVVELAVS